MQLCVSLLPLLPAVRAAPSLTDLPFWEWEGSDNREFGRAMGVHFRAEINEVFYNSTSYAPGIEKWMGTASGKRVYDSFLSAHKQAYPQYIAELEGLADGSGVPFHLVFALNLKKEVSFFKGTKDANLDCSDQLTRLPGVALVAHNEDDGMQGGVLTDPTGYSPHTAMVTARFAGRPAFTAYTFLGTLPSYGWGFNDRGVVFTLNAVSPKTCEEGGLGRNFVSRDLLWAVDVDDALRRITVDHQACGHNYQVMHLDSKRILNVEVGHQDGKGTLHDVLELSADDGGVHQYFHANSYCHLQIDNNPKPIPPQNVSSCDGSRQKAAAALPPPQDAAGALRVIGDPLIYRSWTPGKSSFGTLISILVDLEAATLTMFRPATNPTKGDVLRVLPLPCCSPEQPTPPPAGPPK